MAKSRPPTTPGEILREEFLVPMETTQRKLAEHLGCDIKVINRLVNGKTSVTAEMALKLAATFETTPDFWLNAQQAVDVHRASQAVRRLPKPIRVSPPRGGVPTNPWRQDAPVSSCAEICPIRP